ncbi:phosphate signaling complex protein PhoU [Rhodospirillum sp. A1_3_36]|uniref:phosphate signaling complex protein PhoU n=1 Tax=Rhodospirillum sp. A1_3_36 TaxID=3391666 RepID=UPI0039A769DC
MTATRPPFHTVSSYDDELRGLDSLIQQMGGLAISQTRDAIQGIVNQSDESDALIKEREERINALEHQVNEQVVRLLALRQPVANDLRTVVTALKASSMLERVGDYAANAARRGETMADSSMVPVKSPVTRMGELVIAMLDDALRAFQDRDPELAIQVRERDTEVDALHSSLFRELLTYMLEDPRNISVCSQLMFISKNLERVGDQATNIAEAAYYRATGKDLDMDRPKDDTTSSAVAVSDQDMVVEPRFQD